MEAVRSQSLQDVEQVRELLPTYYVVRRVNERNINCCSTGTNKGMTNIEWELFKLEARRYFDDKLIEFYHNTCYAHQNFSILLK